MKQALKYGASLIGIYLAVVYFDGATSDLGGLSTGVSTIIGALQGRAVSTATKAPAQ
jgi:hypothetical protein